MIKCTKQSNINKGKWNKEESNLFFEAYFLYGPNWKLIQKYIKSRDCTQIRCHWQKIIKKIKVRIRKYNKIISSSYSIFNETQNKNELNIKFKKEIEKKMVKIVFYDIFGRVNLDFFTVNVRNNINFNERQYQIEKEIEFILKEPIRREEIKKNEKDKYFSIKKQIKKRGFTENFSEEDNKKYIDEYKYYSKYYMNNNNLKNKNFIRNELTQIKNSLIESKNQSLKIEKIEEINISTENNKDEKGILNIDNNEDFNKILNENYIVDNNILSIENINKGNDFIFNNSIIDNLNIINENIVKPIAVFKNEKSQFYSNNSNDGLYSLDVIKNHSSGSGFDKMKTKMNYLNIPFPNSLSQSQINNSNQLFNPQSQTQTSQLLVNSNNVNQYNNSMYLARFNKSSPFISPNFYFKSMVDESPGYSSMRKSNNQLPEKIDIFKNSFNIELAKSLLEDEKKFE